MFEEHELVQISALQHYSYCPRQFALIHIEGVFQDNHLTMRGNAAHKRVDKVGSISVDARRTEYALPLFSEALGLVGKADAVEFDSAGVPFPVEYKHGKRHISRHDDLQLAAQALCLEEMTGKPVLHGAIYHHSSRRRRDVEIDARLREAVQTATAAVRRLIADGALPPPVSDNRCYNCSLKGVCQPDITRNADGMADDLLREIIEEDD